MSSTHPVQPPQSAPDQSVSGAVQLSSGTGAAGSPQASSGSGSPAFRRPPALRAGDAVALVAPASSFDRASFEAGLAVLAERYRVVYNPNIFTKHRYLAGDDARRLDELTRALADPSIKAVFSARGGYGSMRLLPQLARLVSAPGTILPNEAAPAGGALAPGASAVPSLNPKPVIGFSDITALHMWFATLGMAGVHGPVLTQLGRLSHETHERLFALLESGQPRMPLQGTQSYVSGTAEGPLLGGNLSVFTRLLGTPYLPPLSGAVLLLEDVGERPYRLDRLWTHLDLAGVFRQVSGIALGEFIGCDERDAGYGSADVLRELAVATGLPCIAGLPIGHGDVNEPVALGARVRLDADTCRLLFLEGAVAG